MADSGHHKALLDQLNVGAPSAAAELDRRYRQQLCRLVEQEMDRRLRRREDPEDVVQSAMRSFFRGVDDGRLWIDPSGRLWRLLERITRRKMLKHAEYHGAARRSVVRETPEPASTVAAGDPSPAEAAAVADLVEKLVAVLPSPYPEILRMRIEGRTESEIAQSLGSTRAAVRYRLERIRQRLRRLVREE